MSSPWVGPSVRNDDEFVVDRSDVPAGCVDAQSEQVDQARMSPLVAWLR
jgi:hypothetical protein